MAHPVRNTILGVGGVVALFVVAILAGVGQKSVVGPEVNAALTPQQMKDLAPRGRELTLAGDCMGCHSKDAGPVAAGGRAIPTPFGILYSTNITPDRANGIGDMTRREFHRALRDGVGRHGNLYPAMPYSFFRLTTPGDVDAVYAYLMSIPASPVANAPPTGLYQLPGRPFVRFWKLLNFPDRTFKPDPARSPEWNRGDYLVRGLGHCGACHSPRNVMVGVEWDRSLQGGSIGGYSAPPLTASALARRGYDPATLTHYLRTGLTARGTSFGPMYDVTHFSTTALDAKDAGAIATFLLTGQDGKIAAAEKPLPALAPAPPPQASDAAQPPGQIVYISWCAGCHGMGGEGIPSVAPAMAGNPAVAARDPRNLVVAVVNGIPTRKFTGDERMYAMPPFAHRLTDQEVADLATWMRSAWGNGAGGVTPADVANIERAVR